MSKAEILDSALNNPYVSGDPDNPPLGIPGFCYRDLYDSVRLTDLLNVFDLEIKARAPALFADFQAYRETGGRDLSPERVSELLVRMAPEVGRFVARLFGVEVARKAQMSATQFDMEILFAYKNGLVKRVNSLFSAEDLAGWDVASIERALELLKRAGFPKAAADSDAERAVSYMGARLFELAKHYARAEQGQDSMDLKFEAEVQQLREALKANCEARETFRETLSKTEPLAFVEGLLHVVERFTYAALHDPVLACSVKEWVVFKTPERIDYQNLVKVEKQSRNGYVAYVSPPESRRLRDGFALTDRRATEREILYEVDHCIYCHDRDRDSCSKGMRKRDGRLQVNPLGVMLHGCPLEEKISEAHFIKRTGDNIGALALITIDNPMVPGTGHRICNDCMKGCIYQKVEPVNIPQIETNILTDVLFMPYGFEIYSLLTRWNPLNIKRPVALSYNGKNILVVGLGPAGYTLAHYLLNEGFGVVGIDALKIEPVPEELTGSNQALRPIRDFHELYEALDKRIMAGFGGVAEYGITVRWDKNFLKVIYLTLARRRHFACYGGVRFGGTLTIDDAWEAGFDHIAIASGAGSPTVIGLKNNLLRGIRQASDFLMALQLTGAAKETSLANLQVRLPAGVIGGGLTAIDTVTELMAYYPVQVEKMLSRYEALVRERSEATVLAPFDEEEWEILKEMLAHGHAVRAEREKARAEQRAPDFQSLIERWGGVTLFYRKGLNEAPAYRQNHEEVVKALQEGISIAEGMNPVEALPDRYGHLKAVRFEKQVQRDGHWISSSTEVEVPLRSLFIAAGTSPNITYEHEHPGNFELNGKFFQRFEPRRHNGQIHFEKLVDRGLLKRDPPAPFTSYQHEGKRISFYGDNHPTYAGNVVKAMASARAGYPYIVQLFEQALAELDPAKQLEREAAWQRLRARLDDELIATVAAVNRLAPDIIEVVARAPRAARKFHPGQFYRVQNLETYAPVVEGTALVAEGLALTGAWVDRARGLISLIALEMGSSSRLCAKWRPGEPLIVMGPTGTPTEIPHGEKVLLVGGGLGNAVLFSIGKAMREAGNQVIYFAGYRTPQGVFKVKDIEAASDSVVWAVDPAPGVKPIPPTRPQDKSYIGNIVEALCAYAEGELGETPIRLQDIDRLIAIGSDRMMGAVRAARFGVLKPYLKPTHIAIGSINSPMQCMMKGVCAQCLCRHEDAATGAERFVYSCDCQDQPLDWVDFAHLHERLRQNSIQEKLTDQWLNHLLARQAGA
jgi:NADPH-dependent glutamate synthase beta chain and related oxidoreductases